MNRPPIPDPPHHGGCLCGAVRFSFNARPLAVVACHCRDCQKLTGATNLLTAYVPTEAFVHEQGEVESYRKTADSGRQADYYRCATCGVRVWHKPLTLPELTMVPVGALDDPGWAVPVAHIWTSRALPSAHIPEDTPSWEMHLPDRLEPIRLFAALYPRAR